MDEKKRETASPRCQPSLPRAGGAGVGEAPVIVTPRREPFALNFEH